MIIQGWKSFLLIRLPKEWKLSAALLKENLKYTLKVLLKWLWRCAVQLWIQEESGRLDETEQKELLDRHLRLAEKGERVIALAYRQAEEQKEYTGDFIFLGFIGIVDPPRPEAREAIAKCHAAGIKVVMITGDHPVTAESIAKERGTCRLRKP